MQTVARALASAYDPDTGLFRGAGWWNSANGITALADVSRALNTSEFNDIFSNTFTAAQKKFPNFRNEFYDDEGWWALAWLDVYQLRREPRYLHMAESIFEDMTGGWSPVCGGGVWWKKDEHYKNAIANELFLSVGIKLARVHTGAARASDIAWAEREKRWFLNSGMLNDRGLVNDGLTSTCQNNQKTTWTYNQGVITGGLVEVSQNSHDPATLQVALKIAESADQNLTDRQGILHDPCEPQCGADGVQFKGIFVRNLPPLLKNAPDPKLQLLLRRNADSAWAHAQMEDGQFACDWAGPPEDGRTGALISVLDLLTSDLVANGSRRVPPQPAPETSPDSAEPSISNKQDR